MPDDSIIARVEGRTARLSLNRPQAIHALTLEMCRSMTEALLAWRDDPAIDLVLIDHASGRGVCAGGDVRVAAESGKGDGTAAREFFHTEYRLNALLFSYPKPVVAMMDGIVMGGGVGVSLPARYRVATERTVLAMPEGAIGLFPDVGAGWYLPRLLGRTGLWMALTAARLRAADCLLLGLATDHVRSADIEAVKAEIVARPDQIEEILTRYDADAGEPPVGLVRDRIDALFGRPSLDAIVVALDADGSQWALGQLAAIRAHSPQTMQVAFRLFRHGEAMQGFEEEMALEYAIAARLSASHDFIEGVRAVLVDKDNAPRWDPAEIEGVDEARLAAIFAPLPPGEVWTPLPNPGEKASFRDG